MSDVITVIIIIIKSLLLLKLLLSLFISFLVMIIGAVLSKSVRGGHSCILLN